MTVVRYDTSQPLSPTAVGVVRYAAECVYGAEHISLRLDESGGPSVLGFGTESSVKTLSDQQMRTYPDAYKYVALGFHQIKHQGLPPVTLWDKTLYLDIETHNAGKQWGMTPREFFRLGQYAWGPTGEVVLTTDYDEIIRVIGEADGIVAHNGHSFDFSVLLGNEALDLAESGYLFDTFVYANLLLPAPEVFTTREGTRVLTVDKKGKNMVGGVKKWLALDNLCYQLGLTGKIGNLQALAKKYNPKGTLVANLDYSLIPIDDPDFLEYARQDVVALQSLTSALLTIKVPTEYDGREQLSAAINAQMTRNGFRVDEAMARARVQELAERKQGLLQRLAAEYGFPTEGKMPWRQTAGKAAIMAILADAGITPETRPDWTKTDTGNISLGGEVLVELTQGTDAEELGQALAELQGQRPLAQQALDFLHPDGYVHHDIAALQRSGRSSTTKPSLTTWSAHGPKASEKAYFIASPGRRLLELDLSNADQRILAAISNDQEYAKRFDEGMDGHAINGRIMFGDDVYDSDPAYYRNAAKAPGHAWTYGAGPKKLASTTGLPLATMQQFADGMAAMYPTLAQWQMKVRRDAERNGATTNYWGRTMAVQVEKSWSQTPALHGQSGTTEILKDGLIRMLKRDRRLILWTVGTVHDALVMDVPETELDWVVPAVVDCLETEINGIQFPVESGKPADDWWRAGH